MLAGAYPGSPDQDDHVRRVRGLWDLGIRTFVNLVEEDETNNSGKPFRRYDDLLRSFAADAGERFAHLRFPVKDLSVPSVDRMRSILDSIDLSLTANRPVYVHCFGGVGRTGVTVCCWLIQNNYATGDDAVELLGKIRNADTVTAHRPAPENGTQVKFVKSWNQK
ncbi:protein phosphatase [Rhodopirellula sp. SM50]|nr:protein phosphatase [Rhodopirellula sp. SM50]